MYFEKYLDEITQFIEINIERLTLKIRPEIAHYSISSENLFELTFEEHQRLLEIVEDISSTLNLDNKFPKKFIFDKLIKEVIIKSYDYSSTHDEIKLNLRNRFEEFNDILNQEINDWTYFVPISGIYIDEKIILGEMLLYPFASFKQEILDYFINIKKISVDDEEYKILLEEINELKGFCFVKLTVNGTKETSKDKTLNKINELLAVFSLYKSHHINGFGVMGDVLPLNSELITYFFKETNLNVSHEITVRNRSFNLTENLNHMKRFHLDYLISLINKNELEYVEKCLLNSIQWYYESVKSEFNLDEDVAKVTLDSNEYYEHHSYFKLGMKVINLVSSLESLLIFNDKTNPDTRKERFNLIMNFKNKEIYDYHNDLDELYLIRNDIAHSNKLYNLLNLNIRKNTNLMNMFIMNFIEIKLAFNNNSKKSLNTKDDLNNFYNGKNRLNNQFDYLKLL